MKGVLKSLGEKVGVTHDGKKHPTSFTVARKEYRVKQLLGEGAYAFVWLCSSGTGDDVAIKQIVADGNKNLKAAAAEVALMEAVAEKHSPHLVRLIASGKNVLSQQTAEYLMVQEYCPVSLFALMQQCSVGDSSSQQQQQQQHGLDSNLVLTMVSHVANGLATLHAMGITHRDVKPENVLRRGDSWLLVDFGSAMRGTLRPRTEEERIAVSEDLSEQTTLIYRAPEMLDLFRGQEIGPPSDVWALGCTMFYALYLNHPFKEEGELGIINGRLVFPQAGRPVLNELISRMLAEDPVTRPSASQVKAQAEGVMSGLPPPVPETKPRMASFGDKSPRVVSSSDKSPRVGAPANVRKADPSSLDPELARSIAAAKEASEPLPSRSPRRIPTPPPQQAPVVVAEALPPPAEELPLRNEEIMAEASHLLGEIKKLAEPEMWKMEIAPECNPPQPKDVVIRAWTVAGRHFSAATRHRVVQFFSLFRSRERGGELQVRGRPLDCLQLLSQFHIVLQSGSFLAVACAHHVRSNLEDIAAANDNPQGELVHHYAQYLADRVSFHSTHRIFEGNMSLGTLSMILLLNRAKGRSPRPGSPQSRDEQHLITGETIKDLLVLLGKAINLEARLLKFRDHDTIVPFVIPVVKETFSLSTILAHCMRFHWLPFVAPSSTPAQTMLEPLNRSLAVLAAHYAELSTIPIIVSSMGSPPPLLGAVPDMRDPSASMHPFYTQALPFPPSHSPFVQAYDQQRAAAVARLQLSQQQAENFFPATFETSSPAPVAVAQIPPQPVVVARVAAEAPPAPVAVAVANAPQPVATTRADHEPPLPDHMPVAAITPSEGPSASVRKAQLRAVGSRRGSIRDISAIREKEIAENAEKHAGLVTLLSATPKEELVEEVLFLRKKVAALETQLAEALLTRPKMN